MSSAPNFIQSRTLIHVLVTLAGSAALSWQVLWQIKSSLALGVSAWGTAITVAVTMGGMSVGAMLMGQYLKHAPPQRPVRLYGLLEIAVGIVGLFLGSMFQKVEDFDTYFYRGSPEGSPLVHVFGIVAVLGIPTICMGATVPVFGLIARQFRTSIAALYGLNTLGAAGGCLIAAFLLIPLFGVAHTAWVIALVNITVGIVTWVLAPGEPDTTPNLQVAEPGSRFSPGVENWLVLVTGFATCALEISWFRSLVSAFQSTTSAFAIMLGALLIALGLAAGLVPFLRRAQVSLGVLVCWAGILILAVTPVIERLDLVLGAHSGYVILDWFILTLIVIGAPVLLLGIALPWILDNQHSSRDWGRIYAFNTLASIVGSLAAAWILLPTIGFARTAWLAGVLVLVTGLYIVPKQRRLTLGAVGLVSLLLAVTLESGAGRTRVQGWVHTKSLKTDITKILEYYEGPEATTSAIEYTDGSRALVINGFVAAGERITAHYMAWMGHLPMLLHPDPKKALVICFGTGQTSNAVRQENPLSLDIVDINPKVPKLAHNFPTNKGVLDDLRVKLTIMDGRAYMRRTTQTYDVITLEPMPPSFAGVNALYSQEFYQLARQRLGPQGVIAQWLPFHLVSAHYMLSIVKTFSATFPNAMLWIDPPSHTGIIVGSVQEDMNLTENFPGFARPGITRDLSEQETRKAVLLNAAEIQRYAASGEIVSDDNQLLAYGKAVDGLYSSTNNYYYNRDELNKIREMPPLPNLDSDAKH